MKHRRNNAVRSYGRQHMPAAIRYFTMLRRDRRRLFFLFVMFVCVVGFYIYLHPNDDKETNTEANLPDSAPSHHVDFRDSHNPHTQSGQACIHPELQLWHPELRKYFNKPEPLQCDTVEPNWVYVLNGTFRISPHVKYASRVLCEYYPLNRLDDFNANFGTAIKPMKDGDKISSDFFKARCVGPDGKIYNNLHAGVSEKDNVRFRSTKGMSDPGVLGMNILMFGFDSVSRMTWIRNLPKTYDYFTKDLGGFVMTGYNIVGDGTPQALLPILTGKTEMELPEARRGFNGAAPVDGHPWIFKDLHRLGYVTQYGEDGSNYGTFNYRMLGFREPPTDYYLRPFDMMAARTYSLHQPHCLGSVPRHVYMLDWIKELYMVYPKQPKFSFLFHSEYSHQGNNKLQVADDDLKDFLTYMNNKGYLDNTLLILMADHGARFTATRGTEQGKFEERMPYFSFRFPPWFEAKYPEAMRNVLKNTQRLTTPFDVHATLRDVLNYTGAGLGDVKKKGISIFKEIPKERTCEDAAIESHWCACLNWQKVDVSLKNVRGAAQKLVQTINSITASHRVDCQHLSLDSIVSAGQFAVSDKLLKFKQSKDTHGRVPDFSDDMEKSEELYQITITTSPGGGRFEATVKYHLKNGVFSASSSEISRVNKYGNQPHCVMNKLPHLRPFCYCKTQINQK